MNVRDEQDFRVLYLRIIQLGRWLLLLVCLVAGLFLLLGQKDIGFGILFLFAALWFILDNPLESFATLVGTCPFCGREIKARRQIQLNCPFCEESIVVDAITSCPQSDPSNANSQCDEGEEVLADFSQREALIIDLGDTLDLHTFSPSEIPSLLEEFIHQSQKAEIYLVKIIHGKGSGALRRRVQALLARNPRVLAFYDAPRQSGGWGATVVELKAPQSENDGEV